MKRPTSAFTLVELCVVVTILAITTGLATVGLRGATESGRLQAAADQLTAEVHAAQLFAITARLPIVLNCSTWGCQLRKLVRRDGRWDWHEGSPVSLPNGISLAGVQMEGARSQSKDGRSWSIPIGPDSWTRRFRFELALVGRHRVAAVTCGFSRKPEWDWENLGLERP